MNTIDPKPRDSRFSYAGDRTRYWYRGDAFRTRFFDAFSSMLPIAEQFFIETLQRCEADIDEPALRAQIRAFISQEAAHGREHRRYNRLLQRLGYDFVAMDRSQKRVLGRISRVRRKTVPLALVVATEHITAILAAAVLRGELLEEGDPEVLSLWKWHAAEEIEHKAVAFEVYQRLGGGLMLRRAMMALAVLNLSVRMSSRVTRMLHRDRVLWNPQTWRAGRTFLFGRDGMLAAIGSDFNDFFGADFHPWQHDNYDLVTDWEASQAQPANVPSSTVARGTTSRPGEQVA